MGEITFESFLISNFKRFEFLGNRRSTSVSWYNSNIYACIKDTKHVNIRQQTQTFAKLM